MTAPLAGDQSSFATEAAGPKRSSRRKPPNSGAQTLLLNRIKRAIGRQWLLFLVATAIVAAAGVGFEYGGGVRITASLPGWLAIGAVVGLIVATINELSRNVVTSPTSLGKHRGYAILGGAPELTPQALRELAPDQRTPLGVLAFAPASTFATAFRDLQGALSADGVVAFIGAIPGEGATTAALCAAISAQQQGRRVILIDCDLRQRALTKALGRTPQAGVFEAVADPKNWQSFVDHEDETGLPFIPAAKLKNAWRNLYDNRGFAALLDELGEAYDLIVLDCPPALAGMDGAMTARTADRCVLVTVWDQTKIAAVRAAMKALRARSRGATGVYVNRVPPGYRFGRLRGE